jgi:fibronectin-binding autotransporter adhesin
MELPLLRKRSAVHRPEPVRRPCPRGVSPARLGSIAAICGALTAGSAKGAIYTWSPTGAGTYAWGLGANWSPAGFPNAIGDTANLNNNLIGNQAISLSQTVTVGSLLLGDPDGTHSFTLQSGANALGAPGTLNLDAVSGFVSILKAAGAEATDVISTGVQFNDDLALTNNSPAGRLLLTGPLRSLESNISFNGAGFINVGAISTGGGLAKSDAGVTVLSGANTYSGATTVNGGTLRLGNNALPVRSAVTVAGGATLDVGFGGTIGSLTGGGTVTTSTGATLTIGRDDTNSTFTGTINGGLNLFKSGQGVLNWAPGAASTYTGTTTLNGGGLVLDFANTTQTSVLAATAMTFGGGDFTIKGKAGLAVNQMLGNLTVDKMGGSFTLVAGDAAGTTVTFGNSITTTTGGALLITAPANTAVRFGVPLPAPSNRLVFSDGTAGNYNWAMNSGGGTATAGFTSYTALPGPRRTGQYWPGAKRKPG